MVRNQAGIVTSDFRVRTIGMTQEIYVMNCDDLGGPPCWRQEGMCRTHHVLITVDQPLDRRPFEVVPRKVQEPDRDTVVGDVCAGTISLQARVRAILPGARE
jgi:hypothetical protein